MKTSFSQWFVPFIVSLAALLGSAYSTYSNNDKELTQRIAIVETQQKNDTPRLGRIEDKVDRILDKLMAKLP